MDAAVLSEWSDARAGVRRETNNQPKTTTPEQEVKIALRIFAVTAVIMSGLLTAGISTYMNVPPPVASATLHHPAVAVTKANMQPGSRLVVGRTTMLASFNR